MEELQPQDLEDLLQELDEEAGVEGRKALIRLP
jgi:hypothetical protein